MKKKYYIYIFLLIAVISFSCHKESEMLKDLKNIGVNSNEPVNNNSTMLVNQFTVSLDAGYTTFSIPTETTITVKLYTEQYPGEMTWRIVRDADGTEVASNPYMDISYTEYIDSYTISAGSYTLYCYDSYGDGWGNGYISIYY